MAENSMYQRLSYEREEEEEEEKKEERKEGLMKERGEEEMVKYFIYCVRDWLI